MSSQEVFQRNENFVAFCDSNKPSLSSHTRELYFPISRSVCVDYQTDKIALDTDSPFVLLSFSQSLFDGGKQRGSTFDSTLRSLSCHIYLAFHFVSLRKSSQCMRKNRGKTSPQNCIFPALFLIFLLLERAFLWNSLNFYIVQLVIPIPLAEDFSDRNEKFNFAFETELNYSRFTSHCHTDFRMKLPWNFAFIFFYHER